MDWAEERKMLQFEWRERTLEVGQLQLSLGRMMAFVGQPMKCPNAE